MSEVTVGLPVASVVVAASNSELDVFVAVDIGNIVECGASFVLTDVVAAECGVMVDGEAVTSLSLFRGDCVSDTQNGGSDDSASENVFEVHGWFG